MTDNEAGETERLTQAIAALEGQRQLLGDAVVETAVTPLRAELAKLSASPRSRRRQVTVMFADLSGYTTLSEQLDPEQVASMLARFWEQIDAVIEQHRGHVFVHMGDGAMAVWGAETSLEDDAEKAVEAALAMIDLVQEQGVIVAGTRIDARISVGINTGLVHLVDIQNATVVGDSVNVAARLESAAAPGQVLMSRSTFHQVRGVFDVEEAGDLELKGRTETVRAYRALRRRPRSFPAPTHGVEGVQTAMSGREDELATITSRHRHSLETRLPCATTILGEPGIGKSRLVHECRDWLELVGIRVRYFEGRCHPDFVDQPFALLRSILAHRFEVNDSDAPALAFGKLATGIAGLMGATSSHVAESMGWLTGLTAQEMATGDNRFRRTEAIADAHELFRHLASDEVGAMLVLEDLHWADAESLDLVAAVIAEEPEGLMVLASGRPELASRRPEWGRDASFTPTYRSLGLEALNHREVDALIDDVLQRADAVPDQLRIQVREQCDGNPFHVEELLKMLIDDGVITTGETWQIDLDRLLEVKVPTTLTGVLQGRLDRLPEGQFRSLQAASVLGRSFWIDAVATIMGSEPHVRPAMDGLVRTELIHRQPVSRFVGTEELLFKHEFTRAVTYETIGLAERPALHQHAGEWLAEAAGNRPEEYAVVIARHFDESKDNERAAHWYERAAIQAQGQSSFVEAARWFAMAVSRCLDDPTKRMRLTLDRCNALVVSGQFDEAKETLSTIINDQDAVRSTAQMARAELARIAMLRDGDFALARRLLEEAIALRGSDSDSGEADYFVRHQLGNLHIVEGDYAAAVRVHDESVLRSSDGGDHFRTGWGMNSLAHALAQDRQFERAVDVAREAIELSEGLDDPRLSMATRAQLGLIAMLRQDWTSALEWFGKAQVFNRRNRDPEKLATVASYLGEVSLALGDVRRAEQEFRESIEVANRAGVVTEVVRGLIGMAGVIADCGDTDLASVVLKSALAQPAAGGEARRFGLAIAETYKLETSGVTISELDQLLARLESWNPTSEHHPTSGHHPTSEHIEPVGA